MYEGEVVILIIFSIVALVAMGRHSLAWMHGLYFRDNPAPGIVRAGVIVGMLWVLYVLTFHADPSVVGVYVWFYLVMGYAVIKAFGQGGASLLGFRTRVDAAERRNVPAAMVIAAFVIATGLIFGGSLWGEADPTGDDEGGWWIPLGFFLLGWMVLVVAFALFRTRERGSFSQRIRRERRTADARAAGAFLLASGIVLTDATAGDFWGWRHGLLSFGLIAAMLLVHEGFRGLAQSGEQSTREKPTDTRRMVESLAYLVLALLAWFASRMVDAAWGPG